MKTNGPTKANSSHIRHPGQHRIDSLCCWTYKSDTFQLRVNHCFPGGSDSKESSCNAGDPDSIPGLGRSPGEKKWQPMPVFLPGEAHGQRSLAGYSPQGCKESDRTERLTHNSDDICVGSFVFLGQLQSIAGGQGALRRLRGCGGQHTSSSLPPPASLVPRPPRKQPRPRAQGPGLALACVCLCTCAPVSLVRCLRPPLSKLGDMHNQAGNIPLTAFSLFTRLRVSFPHCNLCIFY